MLRWKSADKLTRHLTELRDTVSVNSALARFTSRSCLGYQTSD